MSDAATRPALAGVRLAAMLLGVGLIAAAWLRISRPVVVGADEPAANQISIEMRIDLNAATAVELMQS